MAEDGLAMKQQKKDKNFSILAICTVILVLSFVGAASAKTWYVDDDGGADFTGITDAINAANAGDTIIVRDGTYVENVVMNERLTIQSENGSDSTIVLAEDYNVHAFNVTTNYVEICGFTVGGATGAEEYWPKAGILCAGIYLYFVDFCNISSNNCPNNRYGIWIKSSNNNSIINNNCSNNGDYEVCLSYSNSNHLYLNDIIVNGENAGSFFSANFWNSTEKIIYIDTTYTGYFGNYWSDYEERYPDAEEIESTGIWDTPYSIHGDKDNYPLTMRFEEYIKL